MEAFYGQDILKILNLSKNQIRYINEKTFAYLLNLEVLDISSNKLFLLTKNNFANLPKLKELDLSENAILCSHPRSLFGLRLLKRFKISSTSIKLHDSFLHGMDNLEEIKISNFYEVRQLPSNLFKDKFKLNSLVLSQMNISNKGIPNSLLKDSKNIQKLSLINCSLNKVPTQMLNTTIYLIYLDLSFNNLEEINRNSFKIFQRLEYLILRNARIRFISAGVFDIPLLQSLDLSDNNLISLNREAFSLNLLKPLNLILANNEIKCDCKLKWMNSDYFIIDNKTKNIATCYNHPFKHQLIVDVIKESNGIKLPCKVSIKNFGLVSNAGTILEIAENVEVIDKTLICTAQGYPKPEIIWFVQYWRSPKKGQLQNFFGCSQIGFSETNVDAETFDVTYERNGSLIIKKIPPYVRQAQYICLAQNDHSCIKKIFTILRSPPKNISYVRLFTRPNSSNDVFDFTQNKNQQNFYKDMSTSVLCKDTSCQNLCKCTNHEQNLKVSREATNSEMIHHPPKNFTALNQANYYFVIMLLPLFMYGFFL